MRGHCSRPLPTQKKENALLPPARHAYDLRLPTQVRKQMDGELQAKRSGVYRGTLGTLRVLAVAEGWPGSLAACPKKGSSTRPGLIASSAAPHTMPLRPHLLRRTSGWPQCRHREGGHEESLSHWSLPAYFRCAQGQRDVRAAKPACVFDCSHMPRCLLRHQSFAPICPQNFCS